MSWFKKILSKWSGADQIKQQAAKDAEHLVAVAKEAQQTAQDFIELKSQVEELVAKLSAEAEQKKQEIIELEQTKQDELAKLAAEKERISLTPKETATRKKEPWVAVINTHINSSSAKHGFFELDWNEYFIAQLKLEGYGADGDREEDIIDRWFREMCATVVVSGDYGESVSAGFLRSELERNY